MPCPRSPPQRSSRWAFRAFPWLPRPRRPSSKTVECGNSCCQPQPQPLYLLSHASLPNSNSSRSIQSSCQLPMQGPLPVLRLSSMPGSYVPCMHSILKHAMRNPSAQPARMIDSRNHNSLPAPPYSTNPSPLFAPYQTAGSVCVSLLFLCRCVRRMSRLLPGRHCCCCHRR